MHSSPAFAKHSDCTPGGHQDRIWSSRLVQDETAWRSPPPDVAMASSSPRISATRWRATADRAAEYRADTVEDGYVVKIVLRSMNIRLCADGRAVQDGVVTPGMFHVTRPAVSVRCLFRGPYDVLHLHMPNHLLAECARDLDGGWVPEFGLDISPRTDPTVERLGHVLLAADELGGSYGRLYADCVSVAIIARLLALTNGNAAPRKSKVSELPKWRLRRTIEYIDAHLAEPVSLAELASEVGLTRMHFAAQFRAATGLRPHEYLLRRRIERAQVMIAGDESPLVDVALSVGFQTQSHFTNVFKKFVGKPPHAWRRERRDLGR